MGTMYYGGAEGLEESFSFNCNGDFNNFSHNPMAVLMSDDEEEDDDSYIEIAIAPVSTTDEDENEDEEEEAMEFQFRISFSSAPSFPPLLSSQCSKNSPETDSSSSSSTLSSSSTSSLFSSYSSTSTTASMSSEWDGASQKPNPPVPYKTFVSSLKESWEIGDTKDRLCESPQSSIHSSKTTNWGLIQSRKTSKVMTAINYGITKFFVKFRSVKLQSMLSSVKKSQKVTVPQCNIIRHSTGGTCQKDQKQRSSNMKNYFGIGDRSRVAEINMDAFKGIIEAMGVMSIGRRRKDRQPKRKSCPSSIKSSPIHQGSVTSEGCMIYTREHSIQAAIAHCKRSSGVTSESCA